MLEPLIGSRNRERVLLFIRARGAGYARQIALFFNCSLNPIQKQLEGLEFGGVLIGRRVGRTRLYSFSPRYPFRRELQALLDKTLAFYPTDESERLLMDRKRPRRGGKPL